MTDQKNEDTTLNVKNEKAEELIDQYLKEEKAENLTQLVEHIRTCRILVPANLNEKKQPVPCLLQGPENTRYFPIYTSKAQFPETPKSPAILNLPFLAANHMVSQHKGQADGIVINPFTQNLIFKWAMIERIEEVEKKRNQKGQTKTVEMNEQQYYAFERKEFEFGHLPKQFFSKGKEMLDELCSRKEEYIDELYESGYQHPRMYPYLREEFSVMVINPAENMMLVRLDMPERGIEVPLCYRVYLSWDEETEKGRYFTIERMDEDGKYLLGELDAELKHSSHGEIPVDGAELQRVMELLHL